MRKMAKEHIREICEKQDNIGRIDKRAEQGRIEKGALKAPFFICCLLLLSYRFPVRYRHRIHIAGRQVSGLG